MDPASILKYLPRYGVLLCTLCTEPHCIPFSGLRKHILDYHQDALTFLQRKAIRKHALSFQDQVVTPADVIVPPFEETPIDGLHKTHGYECLLCGKLLLELSSMKEHCRPHGWAKGKPDMWTQKWMQTFFTAHQYQKYFLVNIPENLAPPTAIQQQFNNLLAESQEKEKESEAQRNIIEEQNHKVDQTPWLRTTEWLKMFVGRDMEVLATGCIAPTTDDAIFVEVWNEAVKVIKRSSAGITDCHMRGHKWKSLMQWMKSVDEDSPSPSPFSHHIDSATVDKYAKIWAGLIVLCLRSHREPDKYEVPLSREHKWILAQMEQRREQPPMEDYGFGEVIPEGYRMEESMGDLVLKFSAAVVMFEDWETVGVIPYYCGVLGYNLKGSNWYTPDKYTPTLSAIQYCMRVTVFESTLPTNTRNDFHNESDQTPLQIFRPVRDKWLVDCQPTPFCYVHSLLNYGLAAAKGSIGTDVIDFSADGTVLNYKGEHLVLKKWEDCLHKEIEELERLTRKLLGVDELPPVDFYAHSDSHCDDQKDYYFVDGLPGGREASKRWMLDRLLENGTGEQWLTAEGGFRKSKVLSFERDVHEWLRVSSVATPKGCGPSGRGMEMLSTRYRNGRSTVRNYIISDGQMMVYTLYHKSMGLMDQTKPIPRFLPYSIGACVYLYLRYVIPFRSLILRSIDIDLYDDDGFFYSTGGGGCWLTGMQTNAMVEYSTKWAGFRCTTQMFRHITKAIDRRFIRPGAKDEDGDDPEETLTEQEAAHDLMQCHGLKTANAKYGLTSELLKGLSALANDVCRTVCDKHQHHYHVLPRLPRSTSSTHQPNLPTSGHGAESLVDQCQRGLRLLFGRGNPWRSIAQRDAIRAVVSGKPQLLIVLPTAGGKSLAFIIPAVLNPRETSIVIVPLVELAKNVVAECGTHSIRATHWQSSNDDSPATTVIVVTINLAVKQPFRHFASNLLSQGRLARVIVDEAHYKYITNEGFRPEFDLIGTFILSVPTICMSATMPPYREPSIKKDMFMPDLEVFRTSTNRPRTKYSVVVVPAGVNVEKFIVNWVKVATDKWGSEKRGLIFCHDVLKLQSLAGKLRCGMYYSKLEKKEENLRSWMEGLWRLLCATGALSAGMNIQNLPLVLHYGEPWSLSDFVQESGRGGRKGEDVISAVFISQEEYELLKSKKATGRDPEKRGMQEYLIADQCRRLIITGYMDGKPQTCAELNSLLCDNCQRTAEHISTQQKRPLDPTFEPQDVARAKHQRRASLQIDHIASVGERESKILSVYAMLDGYCGACWFVNDGKNFEHPFKFCGELEKAVGWKWTDWHQKTMPMDKSQVACYSCKLPVHWCEKYKVLVHGHLKCLRSDAMSCMVLMAYKLDMGGVVEMGGNRDFNEFLKWMLGTKTFDGKKCVQALFVFEKLISLRRQSNGNE